MIRTDRRRFPILIAAIATLALTGAVLGLLFSTVEAQEGSAPAKPRGPVRHGVPRLVHPRLGRPPGRQHHRLRDTARRFG